MKKSRFFIVALCMAAALFFVPFFWLPAGFVDIGGDGGRLYFIDPAAIIKNMWYIPGSYVYGFADIPYVFFLYLVKQIVTSPTYLIAIEHGLQLSLGFLGMFLIARQMLVQGEKRTLVGIVAGVVYVSLITKTGWPAALVTLNQVFLNVMIFYFLLNYCTSQKFAYILAALSLSVIFSSNFGFGSIPQLLSFYPFSLLFLYFYMKFIVRKAIPVKGLLYGALLFFGLHAMHVLPVIASLINRNSIIHAQVFSSSAIGQNGVDYFALNHKALGKMSVELFQSWLGQNALSLMLPAIALMGFFRRRSKLLSLLGIFFAATLFLVTANITQTGILIYQNLFYLPGFSMFRSFNEKWYFVYAFYFTLLFAVSLFYLLQKKSLQQAAVICFAIAGISAFRTFPFLTGTAVRAAIDNSKHVSTVYSVDPDLIDMLSFVRGLPADGKVLTLPLTSTYLQIAYGKEGGAYLGISTVSHLAGRPDFSGLWTLAPYTERVLSSMRQKDAVELLRLLSLLNIRYIFYNADERPFENLSTYYFINQPDYASLLQTLPVKRIYQKGLYSLYEIDDSVVKPLIYSPDNGVSYTKRNPVFFEVTINPKKRTEPFLLILSNPYYSAWSLTLDGTANDAVQNHIVANEYANGWIIDPSKIDEDAPIRGYIYLTSQNYFYIGISISGITALALILRRKYAA